MDLISLDCGNAEGRHRFRPVRRRAGPGGPVASVSPAKHGAAGVEAGITLE